MMLDKSYPPIISEYLSHIIKSRDEYDGRGIIQGSTKRINPDFMRELEPLPALDMS